VTPEERRLQSIKAQSVNTFGKNFPQDYQTPTIQRKVKGFKPGDDLHHRAILTVYEPFFTGLNEASQIAMVDELASRGVFTGNNPLNMTAMSDSKDHQGGIHRFAADFGIQLKGDDKRIKGTEQAIDINTGEKLGYMKPAGEFLDKIRNLSYQDRVNVLDDFIKYGQDELDRVLRDDFGYEVPARKDQIALYKQMVDRENEEIIMENFRREVEKRLDSQDFVSKAGKKQIKAAQKVLKEFF